MSAVTKSLADPEYRLLFERNLAGVFRRTMDGRILDCNEACARILGYESAEELRQVSASAVFLDPQQEKAYTEHLLAAGQLSNFELPMRRKDGSAVWVLVNVAFFDEGPGIVEGTFVDVTERRQARERILRLNRLYSVLRHLNQTIVRTTQPEELYRQVCRIAVEDGLFRLAWFGLVDRDKQTVEPVAVEGQEAGYMAGLRISIQDGPEGRGPTGTALRQGLPFVCNDIAKAPYMQPWREKALQCGLHSSAAVPVQVRGALLGAFALYAEETDFFEEEETGLLEEIARDVSFALETMRRDQERLAAEKERMELQAREQAARRVASILESITDGFFALDAEGRISYLNGRAEQVLGRRREELLGRELRDACPDLYTPLIGSQLLVAAREHRSVEFEAQDAGRRLWAEFRVYPSAEGLSVYFKDITERRALEDQLRQSQKMEAIGRLAGGVAHDFNNLLTIIGGYGQMALAAAEPNGALARDLEAIVEASDRASALTRQLLAFSRHQVVQSKVFNLNRLVLRMDRMLHRVIGEDVELVLRPASGGGRIKADPAQVEQIVVNLAVNARDAMPKGGRLTVETADLNLAAETRHPLALGPGRYVVLAVGDTGCGMPPEVMEHLFEPFFTTKRKGKGTGLGLSTVYGIVKQSGGEIEVASEPGQGSTFRIYWPRAEGKSTSVRVKKASKESATGTETILLVEDESVVRRLARDMLTRQGYQVLEACGGPDALELWDRHGDRIHMLLTDVVMPQMSGRELAEKLLEKRPALPVLYMSGYTDEIMERHGVMETNMAFLAKPFTREALGRKVRSVLDGAG